MRQRWGRITRNPPNWFLVFSHCYLLSLLLHYGKRWEDPELATVFLFLIAWAIFRPDRTEPFFVAQLLVLLTTLSEYPRLANHSTLQMFIALFAVALAGKAFLANEPIPYVSFGAGLRWSLVVVYFWVSIHKVNIAFLNPVTSCANWYHYEFLQSAFGYSGGLPNVIYRWSPSVAIILEACACAALSIRRTRMLGICVALPIHLYVSLSGFLDFSSLAHAMMLAFLPRELWDGDGMKRTLLPVYRATVLVLVVATYFGQSRSLLNHNALETIQGVFYNLAVVLVIVAIALRLRSFRFRSCDVRVSARSYLLLPAIVFFWGAIPYLGLSTNGSLTMFSNLVTAPGRGNHLLIDTDRTGLFRFQSDLVRVIEMDPLLASEFRYAPTGTLLPAAEIGYQVTQTLNFLDRPLFAVLEEDGTRVVYTDLRASRYNQFPAWNRWLSFRVIDPIGDAKCRW